MTYSQERVPGKGLMAALARNLARLIIKVLVLTSLNYSRGRRIVSLARTVDNRTGHRDIPNRSVALPSRLARRDNPEKARFRYPPCVGTTHDSRPVRAAQRRADLALLGVAAAWGATFVMVKDALDQVGPLTFVAFRFGLSALAMLPFLLRAPRRARPDRTRGGVALAGALVGTFLFAGYALQTAGLQFTGAGRAGFITGLNVVIVPLLAATLGRQRIGRPVVIGVALAMAGLALLSLGDLASQPLAASLGDLLVLGCAVAFALHILAVGRFAVLHDVLCLTFVQIAAVAVFATLAALLWEQPTVESLVAVWPAAAFTGLICTVVAFSIQVQAQRFTSPTHTALVFSTEPVFAAAFAYWLGGEVFGPAELLGCGLILAGMVLAQLDE